MLLSSYLNNDTTNFYECWIIRILLMRRFWPYIICVKKKVDLSWLLMNMPYKVSTESWNLKGEFKHTFSPSSCPFQRMAGKSRNRHPTGSLQFLPGIRPRNQRISTDFSRSNANVYVYDLCTYRRHRVPLTLFDSCHQTWTFFRDGQSAVQYERTRLTLLR